MVTCGAVRANIWCGVSSNGATPYGLVLRAWPVGPGVSKGGHKEAPRLWPSFETPARHCARAPQDEGRNHQNTCRYFVMSTFSGSVPTDAAKSMNFWNCSFCLGVRFLVITYLSIGTVSTTSSGVN